MMNKIAIVEFEKIFNGQSGVDVVVPYSQVANTFPSDDPHPYSFDEKLIDKEELNQWGKENGWEIKDAPELQGNDRKFAFPIRFVRISEPSPPEQHGAQLGNQAGLHNSA